MNLTEPRRRVLKLLADGKRRRLCDIAAALRMRMVDLYRIMPVIEREAGWITPGSVFSEDPFYGLTEAGKAVLRDPAVARAGVVLRLAERDREVLSDLACACEHRAKVVPDIRPWVIPLEFGGHDGSDHSYRLAKLVSGGLADARQRSGHTNRRGSKEYSITEAGIARDRERLQTTREPAEDTNPADNN